LVNDHELEAAVIDLAADGVPPRQFSVDGAVFAVYASDNQFVQSVLIEMFLGQDVGRWRRL
jgi:hypothetical protein